MIIWTGGLQACIKMSIPPLSGGRGERNGDGKWRWGKNQKLEKTKEENYKDFTLLEAPKGNI